MENKALISLITVFIPYQVYILIVKYYISLNFVTPEVQYLVDNINNKERLTF